MKIYAVVESSGEWEDYREYLTCFSNKEKAEDHMKQVNTDRAEKISCYEECCMCRNDFPNIDTRRSCYLEGVVNSGYGEFKDCKNAADDPWIMDEHEARLKELEVIE